MTMDKERVYAIYRSSYAGHCLIVHYITMSKNKKSLNLTEIPEVHSMLNGSNFKGPKLKRFCIGILIVRHLVNSLTCEQGGIYPLKNLCPPPDEVKGGGRDWPHL